eukprot:m.78180 g.78180  ORF g.78180 m.78180 type:complete len:1110 (+) comp14102_c0_seq2:163-3492(+)
MPSMLSSCSSVVLLVFLIPCWLTPQAGAQCSSPCPPGEGCGGQGSLSTQCEPCDAGFWSASSSTDACVVCTPCSFFSPPRFEEAACTTSSDAVCTVCKTCTSSQYKTADCTATADTQCTDCTICDYGKIQSRDCSALLDRQCVECLGNQWHASPTDTFCSLCTACTSSEYQTVPCTPTTDRSCANLTICAANQFESEPATSLQDRKCMNCTASCPTGQYIAVPCSAMADAQCQPCTTTAACQANQYLDGACTTTSTPVCRSCSTSCPAGHFISQNCTATSDVVCSPCLKDADCPAGQVALGECSLYSDRTCQGTPAPKPVTLKPNAPPTDYAINYMTLRNPNALKNLASWLGPCDDCQTVSRTAFGNRRLLLPVKGVTTDCTPVELSDPGAFYQDCLPEAIGSAPVKSCSWPSHPYGLANKWLGMTTQVSKLQVTGRILGTDGMTCALLPGATVASWQADSFAQFNSYCSSAASAKFQSEGMFGQAPCGDNCRSPRIVVDDSATYTIDSVMPGDDGGFQRIHFAVSAPGYVTAYPVLYFQHDPWLNWVLTHCSILNDTVACSASAANATIHPSVYGGQTKQMATALRDYFGTLFTSFDIVLCKEGYSDCPYSFQQPQQIRVCSNVWRGQCAPGTTFSNVTSGPEVSAPNWNNCPSPTTSFTVLTTSSTTTSSTASTISEVVTDEPSASSSSTDSQKVVVLLGIVFIVVILAMFVLLFLSHKRVDIIAEHNNAAYAVRYQKLASEQERRTTPFVRALSKRNSLVFPEIDEFQESSFQEMKLLASLTEDEEDGDGSSTELPPPPPPRQPVTFGPELSLSKWMSLEELIRYVADEDRMESDYLRVPTNALHPSQAVRMCDDKNRYLNVLPNHHSRVLLSKLGDEETSTYINANWLDGLNGEREYILTQGPLPITVTDFWRMVWEYDVRCLVMVTNIIENDTIKCEQYWPDPNAQKQVGPITITSVSSTTSHGHSVTALNLVHTQSGVQRMVYHFWFEGWPDHGVPAVPQTVVSFVHTVWQARHAIDAKEGQLHPVVVHCSAGIGRSGVFVGLDILMQQARLASKVDPIGALCHMRRSRGGCVQTYPQWRLMLYAARDYLVALAQFPNQKTAQ